MSEHDREDRLDAFLRGALLRANSPGAAGLPTPEELEDEEAGSELFQARMERFLQDPFRAARPPRRRLKRFLRAAACFALVLATAFGAAMLNPSARAWVSNIMLEWYSTNMTFRFADTTQGEDEAPGLWLPSFVPEGYAETERRNDFDVFYTIIYEDGRGHHINLSYSPASGTAIAIDNEHGTPELATVWGGEAHLMRADEEGWPSQLIWTSTDGAIAFHLMAEIPAGDLLQMAESIQRQDP